MGKLSILGAARVAALQEIIDSQTASRIAEIQQPKPLTDAAKFDLVKQKAGVTTEEINITNTILKALVDIGAISRYSVHYATSDDMSFDDALARDDRAPGWENYQTQLDQIMKEAEERKNRLWLCETLEEAKAIVGVDW